MKKSILFLFALLCAPALAEPFTVDDAVRLTRMGSSVPALVSPDGKRWVVVTQRGDLESNTNRFQLILIDENLKPRQLAELSSSSNRPAIEEVRWLQDSETVCFLGEQPGQKHQLYSLRCSDPKLRRLVDYSQNLVGFTLTPDLQHLVYAAVPASKPLFDAVTRRRGLVVTNQPLNRILGDPPTESTGQKDYSEHFDLISQRPDGSVQTIAMADNLYVSAGSYPFSLSPDGRYLVVSAMMRDVPEAWRDYQDAYMQSQFQGQHPKGAITNLWRWYLVDLVEGRARAMMDAPTYGAGVAVWSSDSRSLILNRSYAPLADVDGAERKLRQGGPFCLEYAVASGTVRRIGKSGMEPVKWEAQTVRFKDGSALEKQADGWHSGTVVAKPASSTTLLLEEDCNAPPRLFAVEAGTGKRTLVLDLNPELLRTRTLARVSDIEWKARDGRSEKGGLFLPPGAKGRSPLVIQTHGWDDRGFRPEGVTRSAFAAQALANRGFVVVQLQDNVSKDVLTPREGPREMSAYEGLIDDLDSRSLIDRSKVALLGWSRTCYHVKYMLTHSTYPIAAAVVCDGVDGGYFQYLTSTDGDSEAINGGMPFGPGLAPWLASAPGFLLPKVTAPVLVQCLSRGSALGEWEWFSGLRRLGRPVEMLVLENGSHDLTRPWDCRISEQATVDWLSFWLQGRDAPGQPEQNARWRALR